MANSVNTNLGALVALQNLNATNADLAMTQTRINTGKKVSSAKDNGAIWAIAQGQRADIGALGAVKSSLDRGISAVDVGLAAGESMAVPEYKAMVVASAIEDLVISSAVTGTAASWLRPSLVAAGHDPAAAAAPVKRDYGGDPAKQWRDLWAAGQGIGSVTTTEPVGAIVDQLKQEFDAAAMRLRGIVQ